MRFLFIIGLCIPLLVQGQFSAIDLNQDGVQDLVVFDKSTNQIRTFIYEDGVYRHEPSYITNFPDSLHSWMLLRDYNNDGKEDIFTSTTFGIRVYKNTSSDRLLSWELSYSTIFTQGLSGPINLQMNHTDLPSIIDIDYDGDLDIFVFSDIGKIEYHQNHQAELLIPIDTMIFSLKNRDWGNFNGEDWHEHPARLAHEDGNNISIIDLNNDNFHDLIYSNESNGDIHIFYNEANNDSASFPFHTHIIPHNDLEYIFDVFPAVHEIDVNHDGLKDLIISSEISIDDHNYADVSLFLHTGTLDSTAYTLSENQFLMNILTGSSPPEKQVLIYPNPSTGQFFFDQEYSYAVYTSHGLLLQKGVDFQLNLSEQPNGVYIIQLTNDNAILSRRIILEH